MKSLLTLLTVASLFLSGTIWALEPPTQEQWDQYKKDGSLSDRIERAKLLNNHRFHPKLIHHMKVKMARMTGNEVLADEYLKSAPPAGWAGMPTRGDVNIFVLTIEFQDYPRIVVDTTENISESIFGNGAYPQNYPYESLRNYYQRSSYNQLNIVGNVLPWYQTPYPRSDVPETYSGIQNLIKEAIEYHDEQGHDFSQYDNDGDGVVDYFVILWAGPHGNWADFWWGYMTYFWDESFKVDGLSLGSYSWQWESYNYPNGNFSPTVVIHETGHALGLPDYYDYDSSVGPDGGVGGLDMMDSTWGDHNCFSKFMLDWITPTVVSEGRETIVLQDSGTTTDALIIMPEAIEGEIFYEYFMVQNRYRDDDGNDIEFPNDGLLIWHVDSTLTNSGYDFRYDNSYSSHKLLRLMEADGLEEIENGNGRADKNDYYISGKYISPTSIPNSNRYNGTATSITISGISDSGPHMSFMTSFEQTKLPVYRFWSDESSSHFYTMSEAERSYIESSYPESAWRFEGTVFYAYDSPQSGTLPVYRFWSEMNEAHFYTLQESEKSYLENNYPVSVWAYENVAWHAYPSQVEGTSPVYRFWSPMLQSHFYTISEVEKDFVETMFPESFWIAEGIAWYAFPPQ